jgi:general secretion pathway protein A
MQLLEGKAEIAYLAQPYFDHTIVLESILVSLGIEPTTSPARSHRLFYEYLREAQRAGKTCAVVFDEAQDLKRETLEAVRVLSNFETPRVLADFETPAETLLQIVLAGQPAWLTP